MSLEVFRNIPDFPDYQITSWGRVYSKKTNMFIKPQVHDKGYLRVDLIDANGIRKHMKIHRLVAMAFIPNPEGKPQINHIDGNNQNNSISNLEWVTNWENTKKAQALRKAQIET